MQNSILRERVNTVRRFNRFYTGKIGLLEKSLLKSGFPLTQARILYELAHREKCTSNDLVKELGIDQGYVSRILKKFEKDGLVRKNVSRNDMRQKFLVLTGKGKIAFRDLDERSKNENTALLRSLSDEDQDRVVKAMEAIEEILKNKKDSSEPYIIRPHKPGDIGWIIQRHGALYAEEYGWDETFETLCAGILVKFIEKYDPKRERIWIAERDGRKVGTVTLADTGDNIGQLRLLIVEPEARGKGLGYRLIRECIDFAKSNGYKIIKLWTQKNLLEARYLYEKAGFKLIQEEPHHSFGHDLVAEIWELVLRK
ncbi:GNAT family N-acetyltransferase [candidate division KSB1 bacterium]